MDVSPRAIDQPDPDPGPGSGPGPNSGLPTSVDAAVAATATAQVGSSETRPEGEIVQTAAGSSAPEGFPTIVEPASVVAIRREKGRVRFNSNASATKRPESGNLGASGPASSSSEAQPIGLKPVVKARPSVLRNNSTNSVVTARPDSNVEEEESPEKAKAKAAAQERAKKVADRVRRESQSSTPGERPSLDSHASTVASDIEFEDDDDVQAIPLRHIATTVLKPGQSAVHSESESDEQVQQQQQQQQHDYEMEAKKLVRSHTQRFGASSSRPKRNEDAPEEPATETEKRELSEVNDGFYDGTYNVAPPKQYRGSVLSQLLKLYKPPEMGQMQQSNTWNTSVSSLFTGGSTTPRTESGSTTPNRRKWYEQNRSNETLANLVEASARLANPTKGDGDEKSIGGKKRAPTHKRTGSNSRMSQFLQKEEVRITVHIAETLSRQEYIIKFCRALMLFGAPTHRLEEYLQTTARVLEIDGQFLYLPGCMIISFDDKSTHTTEVRIVRTAQGIDLGKLKDVHLIYKEVMHDVIGVEEGTLKLDELMTAKEKFHPWFRVVIFGFTSVCCAPFSFSARLIDLPLVFCFGCLVGTLQLIVAPRSQLYSNVFEVSATVLVSFLARAFGSIAGGELFCFSALAQGGIVMLLPGYMVLSSALELQSRAIVPGSIRIVYAIVYSLLLGYGIMVGALLYGLFDSDATSTTQCSNPLPGLYGFFFVPPFVVCISILYQAKWRQMPVMVIIAFAGYVVNYFSSLRFSASPQIASTLGAFTVGVLANLYSRLRHGVAAATLIPAIFTQVPGGLASTGGLLSGLTTANMLTNSPHSVNGTANVKFDPGESLNTVVFNVGASMIQIAIGIAVGLFLSALIVYPLGKRRSGLFSF